MCRKANAAMIWCLASLLASCDRPADTVAGPREPDGPSLAAASNTWAVKQTVSPWRQSAAAATIDGLVYLAGGRKTDGGAIPRLDAYELATDRWTNLPPMPGARYDANGASMIKGKLYVSGGFNTSHSATRSLFVYDPATRAWSTKASLPQPSCAGGAQARIGGMLYAYTGCYAQINPGGVFFRYDPASNTWLRRAAPPTDHAGGVGAVIDGKLYLVGGFKPLHCPEPGDPGTCGGDLDNALHVYNPTTNSWTSKAFCPLKLTGQSAVALGGKLWVVGGTTDFGLLATLVYDPATNTWTRKAYLPRTTTEGAAAMVGGKIVYVSGSDNQQPGLPGPSKTYAYMP